MSNNPFKHVVIPNVQLSGLEVLAASLHPGQLSSWMYFVMQEKAKGDECFSIHCFCMHSCTHVCPRVALLGLWGSEFSVSLRLPLMSPITPACGHVLQDFHAEGLIVWSQSLPRHIPTHHVREATSQSSSRAQGHVGLTGEWYCDTWSTRSQLLRKQICAKLECRFFTLSALHRGLTFLKLLACDKSILAPVEKAAFMAPGFDL